MVIFKGEKFNHQWSIGKVPGTFYGMSECRWIDQELFFLWLDKLFIPQIPANHHVLLMLDGHGSHFTPDALKRAADEGVIFFCIPPNTAYRAQRFCCFGPLKKQWSSVCHRYIINNPGCVVTKLQFSQLFSQAWFKAIRPETIINGFRKTGVCPLSKHAIEIVEDAEDSISESQSVDIPSTSSTPPPAGCNDSPSTSFGQSYFNSSSLVTNDVTFGESAVETLSPIHTFTTDQIEKFQKRVEWL